MEKKSLPKSASEIVNTILKQAVEDKNSREVIKALIHQGKYDLSIDNENDTLIFLNLRTQPKGKREGVGIHHRLYRKQVEIIYQHYTRVKP